ARRRQGRGGPEEQGACVRSLPPPAGQDRLVGRDQLPQHRQARRSQRRAASPPAATELGGQRTLRTGQGAPRPGANPEDFNASASDGKKISIADLIVLAGSAAVEKAAKDAGYEISVHFAP